MSASVKGLWTKKDLVEAHRLVEACKADAAHWVLADWLVAKVPVSSKHNPHAVAGRMAALAKEIDYTESALYHLRRTSTAWPAAYRVSTASYAAHARYLKGGPSAASQRAERLAATPLNRFGKVHTLKAPVDTPEKWTSINVSAETHAAVVAEARATGVSIRDTTAELVSEALGARVWLAEEVAA